MRAVCRAQNPRLLAGKREQTRRAILAPSLGLLRNLYACGAKVLPRVKTRIGSERSPTNPRLTSAGKRRLPMGNLAKEYGLVIQLILDCRPSKVQKNFNPVLKIGPVKFK